MKLLDYDDFTDAERKILDEHNIAYYMVPKEHKQLLFPFNTYNGKKYLEGTITAFKYGNMNCCGLLELSTFHCFWDEKSQQKFKVLDESLTNYFKDPEYYEGEEACDCDECRSRRENVGEMSMTVICTLSEDQSKWWKVVEEAGYNCVHTWTNINSENEVRLYAKSYFG